MSETPDPDLLPFISDPNPCLALTLILKYGGIDGDYHKAWVLDQVTCALTGAKYEEFVAHAKDGEDGPETYGWEEGIAS